MQSCTDVRSQRPVHRHPPCCCTPLPACTRLCTDTRTPLPRSQQVCVTTGTLTHLYGQDVGLHTHQHTIPRVPARSQTLHKGPPVQPGQGKQLRQTGWGERGEPPGLGDAARSCCGGYFTATPKILFKMKENHGCCKRAQGRRGEFIIPNWVPPLQRRGDEVLH